MPVFLTNTRSRNGVIGHPALALDVVDGEHPALVQLVERHDDSMAMPSPSGDSGPHSHGFLLLHDCHVGTELERTPARYLTRAGNIRNLALRPMR